MKPYPKVYFAADSTIGDTLPHIPFEVRFWHDQPWMREIEVLADLQQQAAPTDRATTPRLVAVPKFDQVRESFEGGVGRVEPNWFAIGHGAFWAIYLGALFYLLFWLVPELATFNGYRP